MSSHIYTQVLRLVRDCQLSAYAHFGAAEWNSKVHLSLGIPTVLISIALGSVIVADVQQQIPDVMKWIAGGFSLLGALLASLQTFFNPKEVRGHHRDIANRYLAVSKRAQYEVSLFNDSVSDLNHLASVAPKLLDEYILISNSANEYPTTDKNYDRAKRKLDGFLSNNPEYSGD